MMPNSPVSSFAVALPTIESERVGCLIYIPQEYTNPPIRTTNMSRTTRGPFCQLRLCSKVTCIELLIVTAQCNCSVHEKCE